MEIGIPPSVMHRLIFGELQQPTVFKGLIEKWSCRFWTLKEWAKALEQKKICFRIGELNPTRKECLWEGDCNYLEATLEEFSNWLKQGSEINCEDAFKNVDSKLNWCYADYKYMAELFKENKSLLDVVDWSPFGFPGRNGQESSLWIGSQGSSTPCHYDVYGCNLVAQLYGEKRWILFPPQQTDKLQPTRIPYEESSVFSQVNISDPQLDKFPTFTETTPYVISLQPGDVLFVPRHWWHYVESFETSIAVNTWIEMPEDDESRLEEAVTRLLISTLAPVYSLKEWLNPTEDLTTPDENLSYMQNSLQQLRSLFESELHSLSEDQIIEASSCLRLEGKMSAADGTTCTTSSTRDKNANSAHPTPPKRTRLQEPQRAREITLADSLQDYKGLLLPVKPVSFHNYLHLLKHPTVNRMVSAASSEGERTDDNIDRKQIETFESDEAFAKLLINCVVHPEVIGSICKQLKKKAFI